LAISLGSLARLGAADFLKRETEVVTYNILSTTDTLKWDVDVNTELNQDSGDQNLQIVHKLTAPILYQDVITFQLGFQAESIPVLR